MIIGPATASPQPIADRPAQPNAGAADTVASSALPSDNGAPLINPVLTVESSGLVVLQYRNDAGEVEVQIPSEQAVRAYEQHRTEQLATSAAAGPETHAAATGQAVAVQPRPQPSADPVGDKHKS